MLFFRAIFMTKNFYHSMDERAFVMSMFSCYSGTPNSLWKCVCVYCVCIVHCARHHVSLIFNFAFLLEWRWPPFVCCWYFAICFYICWTILLNLRFVPFCEHPMIMIPIFFTTSIKRQSDAVAVSMNQFRLFIIYAVLNKQTIQHRTK